MVIIPFTNPPNAEWFNLFIDAKAKFYHNPPSVSIEEIKDE
jgi:hypothetical protein